jgi:GGDEF domain-containing protein
MNWYRSARKKLSIYPDDTRNTEELVRLADQAMYAAKNQRYQQGWIIRWHENEYVNEESANSDKMGANPAVMYPDKISLFAYSPQT